MDLKYLFEYVNLITLGICLCAGFALKTAFSWFPNKYIPLAALCGGCLVNILINMQAGDTVLFCIAGIVEA